MAKGHLLARLYVGGDVEVIGRAENKVHLMVVLSSRLEEEASGISGDIIDTSCNQVIYRCCRSSFD
jgi:hypothetical protein